MRFAVSLPQLVGPVGFDPAGFRTYVARAEELGFESAWVQQQLLGPSPMLSPLETLAFASAASSTIRLGCAVIVSALHSPVHLARELASVDQLSRGRLEIGVVAGGRGRNFAAFGLSPEGAVSRFNEGLRLMKALWSKSVVTSDGRFWQLDGASVGLAPFQQPHPPIWFGGHHPDALRRAVRDANGFIGAGSQTSAAFADQARLVAELLDEQGGVPGFRVAKRVYIAVDDDARRARQRIGAALRGIYSGMTEEQVLAFAVVGPPADCAARLQEVADAGAGLVVLNPVYDEAEQMERLAGEVVPLLS